MIVHCAVFILKPNQNTLLINALLLDKKYFNNSTNFIELISSVKEFFPNAKITADKFHVLRLTNPMINKARTEITGDKRSNPVRKLLLRSRHRLKYCPS